MTFALGSALQLSTPVGVMAQAPEGPKARPPGAIEAATHVEMSATSPQQVMLPSASAAQLRPSATAMWTAPDTAATRVGVG